LNGWIKLDRSAIEHWTFQKPDYFRAWIDLLVRANHREKKKLYNNALVVVKRGELATSLGALAKRWDMSVGRVRHFLHLLEKDGMILKKNTQDFTHLSICKYETYQNSQHTDNTLTAHSQQIDNKLTATPKERKNVKKERKKENARDFEFQKHLFDKLRNRFGLMEDHYPAYRHHIEGMLIRWTDKTETLVDAFLGDKESGIRDLRYLCEQGIDKYAAPKREKTKFKKTPNGEYVAYCSKCSNQLFYPTLKSLQTSSDCHAADLIPERPHAKKTITQNISAQS
jgi:hypothetical protein